MAHAIRGAAAPAQSLPAPSSLPKNRGGSEYRLVARQKAPRSRRPSQYGARSCWHAPCSSPASRERPVPRQRSLSSVRSHADFSKRRSEEGGRSRQVVRPSAHPAPWPAAAPDAPPGTPSRIARRPSCPVDTQTARVHSPPRSPSASHSPPCPGEASPCGALPLRSAPGNKEGTKGEGGEGLRASSLRSERLRGQAEAVCIKPPPRTSGQCGTARGGSEQCAALDRPAAVSPRAAMLRIAAKILKCLYIE